MSEPIPQQPTPQQPDGTVDDVVGAGSPHTGAVPEVTDPDTVALPEPELAEPLLSPEVEDEDVRGALAEAGEVEGEAQRASSEVGSEVASEVGSETNGPGAGLDVDPTSGPH